MTEVGDAVGVLDEASFEGAGFEFAAVVEDAVFDLDGEVQSSSVAFEFVDDADALFVVFEVAGDFLQGLFSYVAEGVWPRSWPKAMASTRSSFRRRALAMVRPICATSRVCVMRVL